MRARRAIEWTRETMKPGWFSSKRARQAWSFLEQRPLSHIDGDSLLVHGSPRDPTCEYILPMDIMYSHSDKMTEIFAAVDRFLFVGHTHIPCVMAADRFYYPDEFQDSGLSIQSFDKVIVNVGAVGQPRDNDPRACYVEILNGQLLFHRVEYEVQTTVAAYEGHCCLHKDLGTRLLKGR